MKPVIVASKPCVTVSCPNRDLIGEPCDEQHSINLSRGYIHFNILSSVMRSNLFVVCSATIFIVLDPTIV